MFRASLRSHLFGMEERTVPLTSTEFQLYPCRNVGLQPKCVQIWNFIHKFAPEANHLHDFYEIFSIYACLYKSFMLFNLVAYGGQTTKL